MADSDHTPKQQSLALLRQALNTGIRGKNKDAILDAIETLEDDGRSDIKELAYRRLKSGKVLRDPRRPGFQMRATKSQRIWIYRYSWDGIQREMQLGHYPKMSLHVARERWLELRQRRLQGFNPEQATTLEPNQMTIEQMVNKYIELAQTRKRSWKEDHRQFEYDVLPHWADRVASSITPDDAEELIARAYERSPRSGEKLLTLMRFFYNVGLGIGRGKKWHLEGGQLRAKPWFDMPAGNPFASIGMPDREHRSAYLDEKGLRLFLTNLDNTDLTPEYKDCLLLQLQTASRVGEVAAMTWDEVNLEEGVWTLPADRAKNKREHRVMLSKQSLKILKRRKKESTTEWVFTSPRTGTALRTDVIGKGLARNRKILKAPADFTSHSLRHTAVTALAQLGASRDIRDRITNHAADERSDMDARYNKHSLDKEARKWLQKWSNRLDECVQSNAAGIR